MSQTVMKARRWVQAQNNNILVFFIECNECKALVPMVTISKATPTNSKQTQRAAKPQNTDEPQI